MDVVVTVPQHRWQEWLAEGALPGESFPPDVEYYWFGSGNLPRIAPSERVYIVALGRVRGHAPLVRVATRGEPWWPPKAKWALVRHGGAVACTIPEAIRGFQGYRYRWWRRDIDERPFPDWQAGGSV